MSCESLSFEKLTGTQKVAIFLMAVGDEVSRRLFTQMEDDEIHQIGAAALHEPPYEIGNDRSLFVHRCGYSRK